MPSTSELILWDSFNDNQPFTRDPGYHQFTYTPEVGSAATVRYWEPGTWGGAPGPSHVSFTPTGGYFGGGVAYNYSGSGNGYTTMDEIAYSVGDKLEAKGGAIEFWYKPFYDSNDGSAVMYLFDMKPRIDNPNGVYQESLGNGVANLALAYAGWGGRKQFLAVITDAGGPNVQIDTPGEGTADRFTFAANEWMHLAVVWDGDGIESYGGKTLALFVNGVEIASTTQTFSTTVDFDQYLSLGSQAGCVFLPNSPAKCYSGASGSFDNVKIWNYAKTDFSDRFVEGIAAPETLVGTDGDDTLTGPDGNDIVKGLAGNDSLTGGTGRDRVVGGEGNDTGQGDDGDDTVFGKEGDDDLTGGAGNDRLHAGIGDDTVLGEAGNDQVIGKAGRDSLDGGSGDDQVSGHSGDDQMQGGDGNDVLGGGDGADTIDGGTGADRAIGHAGNDEMAGGSGADTLLGSEGEDTLDGGLDGDRLFGGRDGDQLSGGDGADTVIGSAADLHGDTITDLSEADLIRLNGVRFGSAQIDFDQPAGLLRLDTDSDGTFKTVIALPALGSGFFTATTSAAGDDPWTKLKFTAAGLLDGTDGDDTLTGTDDAIDVINGRGGNDVLSGLGDDDQIDGGDGHDGVDGGSGADTLSGGAGDDTIDGGEGGDEMAGGSGADTFVLGLDGGASGDVAWSPWAHPDGTTHWYAVIDSPGLKWTEAKAAAEALGGHLATITSAAENAFVFALAQATGDTVEHWLGGFQPAGSPEPAGNWQWVTGEPFAYAGWATRQPDNGSPQPEDYLHFWNQPGWNDIWNTYPRAPGFAVESVAAPGFEVITDFTPGEDTLDLRALGIGNLNRLAELTTQVGDDVLLDLSEEGGRDLTLKNLNLFDLQSGDFLL